MRQKKKKNQRSEKKKTTYGLGKYKFTNYLSDKGLIFKTFKELINPIATLKIQITKFKMVKVPEWTFLQRRHRKSQQVHEKVFNITSY